MDYASSILGFLPGGRRSTGISQLLDKLEAYLSPAQVERVREAYEFGAEKHRGQKRVSGEPYITHPVAVADILADLRLDADTLVAAILHDVIEDTPTAKAEIASIFGQVVAELVDGVSKLDQIQFKNRQEAQAESFRKMLLAMVRDIRVIMVKLADRMHNMRTLGVMPPVKRRRSARETLEIYAPIAERLGLYAVKLELEDLGFRALYPYRYKVLERELKRARGNQKEFIGKIAETFKTTLKKALIAGEVEGREKHLYSIYKKMQNKKISLNEMVDVYGFRIIVGVSGTCYVKDDYFADVLSRYSLRQAIEERFVKTVEYVAEMPQTNSLEEKWQLIYKRHQAWKNKLRQRGIRPLTIIVTRDIRGCEQVAEELMLVVGLDRRYIILQQPKIAQRRYPQPGLTTRIVLRTTCP